MEQQIIKNRLACFANHTVERVYLNDKGSQTLAAFEYGYQADIFAKALSKESEGVIVVRMLNCSFCSESFEAGKKTKLDHWSRNLKWDEAAK